MSILTEIRNFTWNKMIPWQNAQIYLSGSDSCQVQTELPNAYYRWAF